MHGYGGRKRSVPIFALRRARLWPHGYGVLSPAGVVCRQNLWHKAASSSRPEEDPSTCCCMTVTTRPYFDSSIRSVSVWFFVFFFFLVFFWYLSLMLLLLCSCVCRLMFGRFVLSVGILFVCAFSTCSWNLLTHSIALR